MFTKYIRQKYFKKKFEEWNKESKEELQKIRNQKNIFGETPELLLREGDYLIYSNDFENGINTYKKILEKEDIPKEIKVRVYSKIANLTRNIDYMNKAIQSNRSLENLYNRATILMDLDHINPNDELLAMADSDLNECIEKNPDFYPFYTLRSIERLLRGDEKGFSSDVIESFSKASIINYEYDDYFVKWKDILKKMNDKKIIKSTKKEIKKIVRKKNIDYIKWYLSLF